MKIISLVTIGITPKIFMKSTIVEVNWVSRLKVPHYTQTCTF